MRRRHRLALSGVALFSSVLGACSNNGDGAAPASTTSTATGPSTTTTAADTTTTACAFAGDERQKTSTASGGTMLLTDVRTGAQACFEQVVFEFRPQEGTTGAPAYGIDYASPPFTEDASGKPVVVEGSAFLRVGLEPASGADLVNGGRATYTGPRSVRPGAGARHVVEVRRTGDFEGRIEWIIGLDARRPYKVLVLSAPIRVVVQIG